MSGGISRRKDPQVAWSGDAKRHQLEIVTAHAADLREEAARVAGRAGADTVGPKHVDIAAEHIGMSRFEPAQVFGDGMLTVGSILTGAGGAFFINLATGAHAATWLAIVLGVVTIVGVGAVVWAITYKVVRAQQA